MTIENNLFYNKVWTNNRMSSSIALWMDVHRSSVALYAKDVKIWLNQQQMAELFATSKPNISMHIANILNETELFKATVVKEILNTAAEGKNN